MWGGLEGWGSGLAKIVGLLQLFREDLIKQKKSNNIGANLNWLLTAKTFYFALRSLKSEIEKLFKFAAFAFKIKVSIILKMIQWNYQLTKQHWLVCAPETVLLFNRFWFWNLPSGPEKLPGLSRNRPQGWGKFPVFFLCPVGVRQFGKN